MNKEDAPSRGCKLVFGIVFLLLGFTSLVLLTYYWDQENVKEIHGRFGIFLDAGGSGTRMHVYEYDERRKKMRELEHTRCEETGLANYGKRQKDISTFLNNCLRKAEKAIPITVAKTTPVYMGATGGMRMLKETNETLYNNIWQVVRKILNNGTFPVKIARTLSGKEEGGYSWTTVNTLLNRKTKTTGLYELGSSSFQLAFEPQMPSTNIPDDFKHVAVLNERKYNVYAHSYLCFGKTEVVRRYQALLVEGSNYSATIDDPCSFRGHNESVSSSNLWQRPCVVGSYAENVFGESIMNNGNKTSYTLQGTGNFSLCLQRIQSMFNTTGCNESCGVNGIYQPNAHGLFTAIGGGVYYSSLYLNIEQPASLETYRNATKRLCSIPFGEIKNRTGFSDFVKEYCLADVYNYFLMKDVLKLNGEIQFVNKINGESVTWTLGSMLTHINEMSHTVVQKTKKLSNEYFYPLITISVLMTLLGISLVIIYKKSRLKNNKEVTNRPV